MVALRLEPENQEIKNKVDECGQILEEQEVSASLRTPEEKDMNEKVQDLLLRLENVKEDQKKALQQELLDLLSSSDSSIFSS